MTDTQTRDTRRPRQPGADADRPGELPRRGWVQVLKRAWKESSLDNVGLLAGGVAYSAFMALVPSLVAAVMVYGLVSTPEDVARQVEEVGSALPSEAQTLLTDQMERIASAPQQGLGIGLVIALLLALWSASAGVAGLVGALNSVYDEVDERNFVKKRGLSLLLTVGALVFVAVAVGLVAVLPAVLDTLGLGVAATAVVQVLRWLGLVLAFVVALAVLYRVAPDRDSPRLRWVTPGAVVATVLWVIASAGFSLYVDRFGSYGDTYGPIAGVVVLL
ncbi:MAG TPA: YihY/virulence factor BrkB family protein, partial [Jiangellales bacterium]|nr:YihY/virulence factor BrkB family protein [Jiangellales bacterium]